MSRIITTGAGPKGTRPSDQWRTPTPLFEKADEEFDFTLDAAADAGNALCARYFGAGSPVPDALAIDWRLSVLDRHESIWCNPPYSNIPPFIERAILAGQPPWHVTPVLLLPFSPSEAWWDDIDDTAAEVRRIAGRVRFLLPPDGATKVSAMFPSCLVVWRPRRTRKSGPQYLTWDYR